MKVVGVGHLARLSKTNVFQSLAQTLAASYNSPLTHDQTLAYLWGRFRQLMNTDHCPLCLNRCAGL